MIILMFIGTLFANGCTCNRGLEDSNPIVVPLISKTSPKQKTSTSKK